MMPLTPFTIYQIKQILKNNNLEVFGEKLKVGYKMWMSSEEGTENQAYLCSNIYKIGSNKFYPLSLPLTV